MTKGSKSKTPVRWSNRKRARRSKTDDASSKGSFHGDIIHTLTVKKTAPQIVEISSKDTRTEKDNTFDEIPDMYSDDDFNPKGNDSPPQSNGLENRVSKMENKLDKIIDTIDVLAKLFIGSKSSFDTPKKVIPAFKEDNIDRSPKDDVERILKKLIKGDVGKSDEQKNLSTKKVFSSPYSAKSRGMVLVTKSTPYGYYLNPSINEEDKDEEKIIGEFVPQCLKDMFKPRTKISLSKAEAAVASYIFCHPLKEELDRKEILVKTKLESVRVFIPMNDDNYHWYLVVLDFINKEVVYLDSFPSVVKREARLRSVHTMVDEGTRLRIALDLALNPGNILQDQIVDRALVWLESLLAGGGDQSGTSLTI
ncbi:Ulp1 protease family, C-terminal catalytic domain [Sesbania bispinosa]|nr:Ulp1 protease family, C-terminal catalytic domain [Sesbania bispinosa]